MNINRTCDVPTCTAPTIEAIVYRGPTRDHWAYALCAAHWDADVIPPAGYELAGGGGPLEVVEELFA